MPRQLAGTLRRAGKGGPKGLRVLGFRVLGFRA